MTEPSGYRPGGDCSCCGNCGIFCIDKDVPCLSVAFGTSTRTDSVPATPCLDSTGWDCDGHAAEGETPDTRACLPDGATIEMTGEQGSVVERLPDWAVSEDYTPLAGSYFCRWGTTIELREPFCICPNNDGTCTESWSCESCDCYWTDPGCPPGTNCQEDAQCWCYGYITSCDTGCYEVSCYAGAFDCTLGTCCNVLDPNSCLFYPGNTCQGNDAFFVGTYGCDWVCDPYNYGNLCSSPFIPPEGARLMSSVLSSSGWLMLAQVLFVPTRTTSLPAMAVL